MSSIENVVENHCDYAADIKSLFQLVTNSIYKDKEIFLRELISNASDACEKLRQEVNFGKVSTSVDFSNLKIIIISDPKNKKMIIWDNGIGLNKDCKFRNKKIFTRKTFWREVGWVFDWSVWYWILFCVFGRK